MPIAAPCELPQAGGSRNGALGDAQGPGAERRHFRRTLCLAAFRGIAMIDRFFGVTASGSTVGPHHRRDHDLADDGLYRLCQPGDPGRCRHGSRRGFRRDLSPFCRRDLADGAVGNYPWRSRREWGSTRISPMASSRGCIIPGRWRSARCFCPACCFSRSASARYASWIVEAIPRSQKMAISAGIGLFLGIIALKDAGIVVASPGNAGRARHPRRAGRAARVGRLCADGRARPARQ